MSADGRFAINLEGIRGFLDDLGTFVVNCIEALTAEELQSFLVDLGRNVLKLISGIESISAERDSTNEAGAALPPVLPYQLEKLRGRDFRVIVRTYHDRLITRWSSSKIDMIEQQFEALLVAFQSEEAFKKSLEGCDDTTEFKDSWSCCSSRFPILRDFCGGLATVFPGTATVESDFSIVKYVKNDFRTALTDFSLEGILHTKQFRLLQAINI